MAEKTHFQMGKCLRHWDSLGHKRCSRQMRQSCRPNNINSGCQFRPWPRGEEGKGGNATVICHTLKPMMDSCAANTRAVYVYRLQVSLLDASVDRSRDALLVPGAFMHFRCKTEAHHSDDRQLGNRCSGRCRSHNCLVVRPHRARSNAAPTKRRVTDAAEVVIANAACAAHDHAARSSVDPSVNTRIAPDASSAAIYSIVSHMARMPSLMHFACLQNSRDAFMWMLVFVSLSFLALHLRSTPSFVVHVIHDFVLLRDVLHLNLVYVRTCP